MGYIDTIDAGSSAGLLVSQSLYGTCSTTASTIEKAVTCAAFDHFTTGVTISVKFTNGNTASNPTLNVNNKGAKAIYRDSNKAGNTNETS